MSEYNLNLDTKIIFGLDNEFDKAELYNYYTDSAYAEMMRQYFHNILIYKLELAKTYATFGLRRDEHTTVGEYYTGRVTDHIK